MRPRMIRAAVGAAVTLVAAFVAPAALTMPAAAAAAGALAQAAGPHLGLIAVQQTVTVPESNDRPILIDPDVWIASSGSLSAGRAAGQLHQPGYGHADHQHTAGRRSPGAARLPA